MMYELSADYADGHYAARIVEAPAHRRGEVPAPVAELAQRWAGAVHEHPVAVYVAEYRPARIGYRAPDHPYAVAVELARWTVPA
jgi:hypothetical protein